MSAASLTPSLTPSRSPSPAPPVQPDHFYGAQDIQLPSPSTDGKGYLDPDDDPLASRGIPVFKPTMEEFRDFEQYMNQVEVWGMRSGIVKIIPPKEWSAALPSYKEQLAQVKIKSPIEQNMLGRGGLFRQENIEKRRHMSVREWAELCAKDEMRAPGVRDVGLHARSANAPPKTRTRRGRKKDVGAETADPDVPEEQIKEEDHDMEHINTLNPSVVSPPDSGAEAEPEASTPIDADAASRKASASPEGNDKDGEDRKRDGNTKQSNWSKREAQLAHRATLDAAFLETFDPHRDWLPPHTQNSDYTVEFCQKLERQYWRNCGLGKPAWYGADTLGSLYTPDVTSWNVASLSSALSRLLPSSSKGLPGVNTPYLYFGMWRATFAWHVEDMDLFSINYIHFGAPKYWYAIPQARAKAMEQTMRGYFPKDTSACPQFLRHKSFLASPTLLANSSCRPNTLVQKEGEFVITFPRGYHAGFNLGFNCAESVNFALESWLELGRKARACECVSDSVRIDVDQLLADREAERNSPAKKSRSPKSPSKPKRDSSDPAASGDKPDAPSTSEKKSRKRKSDGASGVDSPTTKKARTGKDGKNARSKKADAAKASGPTINTKVTLKLGPRPEAERPFPCVLCASMSEDGLLRVLDPPPGFDRSQKCMAHETCANVVPETWVDDVDEHDNVLSPGDGKTSVARVVFGVDGIVKDRWNLKCSACTKTRQKAHGAPVQCTKGKCPKAFHVSCAQNGAEHGIVYQVLREVEKEVVLLDPVASPPADIATSAPAVPAPEATLSSMGEATPAQAPVATVDPHAMDVDVVGSHAGEPWMSLPGAAAPPSNAFASSPYTFVPPSGAAVAPEPTVLKIIRKTEAQILCSQHNPAVAAAKKASKQDKIRSDLLGLPSMARIKIRVSAGVFEVSLVRVMEETGSVEVLWDRGIKREFKWGSIVWGSTEGQTVMQKPFEPAPESEQVLAGAAPSYPIAVAPPPPPSQPISTSASLTVPLRPIAPPAPYMAPVYAPAQPPHAQRSYASGAWGYQYHQYQEGSAPPPAREPTPVYPYAMAYQATPVASSAHHNGQAYAYPQQHGPPPSQDRLAVAQSGQTHSGYRTITWQQPYSRPTYRTPMLSAASQQPQSAHHGASQLSRTSSDNSHVGTRTSSPSSMPVGGTYPEALSRPACSTDGRPDTTQASSTPACDGPNTAVRDDAFSGCPMSSALDQPRVDRREEEEEEET